METQYRITLAGQDVSEDITSVDSIQNRLDIPNLTEYAVSEVVFTLMPNRFDYAPDHDPNFFTERMHPQTGFRVPVRIEGGFRGEPLTTLFEGILIELTQVVDGQAFRFVATDRSIDLRDDTIKDFGLRKNNTLRAAAEQTTLRGEFHFHEAVSPVSDESVSGTLGGNALVPTQNFLDEGQLSERNFQIDGEGSTLLTEVAPADDNAVLNATYKAPLRGVSLNRVIRELLTAYGITPSDVKLPLMVSDTVHWSHVARPAYEIESASGTNNVPFGWNGYVTDILRNDSTGDLFMLYSHWAPQVLPQLLRYDASTDAWSGVLQASSHAEWWQLATADFDTFFILQTTGRWERGVPRLATYNPAEANSASPARTSILKATLSSGTQSTFVNSGSRRPQMAMHYWYGFRTGTGELRANNARFGFLPETRTGFVVAENALWYRYASSSNFGLARIRTSNGSGEAVITIPQDEFDNEASFDFVLDTTARKIYASHTAIGESGGNLSSRHLVYERDMPASY